MLNMSPQIKHIVGFAGQSFVHERKQLSQCPTVAVPAADVLLLLYIKNLLFQLG